eukprot:Partr_v1_DN27313_c3_g1_i2_m46407 putative Nucleolar protein 9
MRIENMSNQFDSLRPPSKRPRAISESIPNSSPASISIEYQKPDISNARKVISDTECIIGLMPGQRWSFVGHCMARSLRGAIAVYGHVLLPLQDFVPCYSPSTHAPVTFSSYGSYAVDDGGSFAEGIVDFDRLAFESILHIKTIADDGITDSICKVPIYGHIFQPLNGCCRLIDGVSEILPENSGILTPLEIPLHWNQILSTIIGSNFVNPVSIAICGSKGHGKSTFAKFAINSMLQTFPSVCYLETDCGQPEFTTAGVLSLQIVSSPIIGPAYTHISFDNARTFGYNTPENDPIAYFKCILSVFDVYQKEYRNAGIPLVINTHGWIKGIGLDLVHQILQLCRPDFVLQFVGLHANGELKQHDIVTDDVKTSVKSAWCPDRKSRVTEGELEKWNFQKLLIPPAFDADKFRCKWTATDQRILRAIFYFASFGYQRWNFLPVTAHTPKYLPLRKIVVTSSDGKSDREVLTILNASFVGLHTPELSHETLPECRGIGIVRAVTHEKNTEAGLYIVTPLSSTQLNDLNVGEIQRIDEDIAPVIRFQDPNIKSSPYCETFVIDGIVGHKMRKTRRNLLRKYHG